MEAEHAIKLEYGMEAVPEHTQAQNFIDDDKNSVCGF